MVESLSVKALLKVQQVAHQFLERTQPMVVVAESPVVMALAAQVELVEHPTVELVDLDRTVQERLQFLLVLAPQQQSSVFQNNLPVVELAADITLLKVLLVMVAVGLEQSYNPVPAISTHPHTWAVTVFPILVAVEAVDHRTGVMADPADPVLSLFDTSLRHISLPHLPRPQSTPAIRRLSRPLRPTYMAASLVPSSGNSLMTPARAGQMSIPELWA